MHVYFSINKNLKVVLCYSVCKRFWLEKENEFHNDYTYMYTTKPIVVQKKKILQCILTNIFLICAFYD